MPQTARTEMSSFALASPESCRYKLADQQRMNAARRYLRWQADVAKRELGRRVLEVGCGLGNFSDHLGDRELVIGTDVDEMCVQLWRERFADRRHYFAEVADAGDRGFGALARHRIDSIACVNVLEHIENDDEALRSMRTALPAGGRAVLIVPAFEALYGEIDARLGHHRRYTRASLKRVAGSAGFRLRQLRFMNVAGFFGWWMNAKILRRTEQSGAQIALFDACVVPVMSHLEAWIAPPFGQSILAVLEK